MSRITSLPHLRFLLALSVLFVFAQGCCGIGSGPSVSQVTEWMSVIQKGDSGDKAVSVLKSKGFKVFDTRLTPEEAQRMREQGRAMERRENLIVGDRIIDMCIFTVPEKHVEVEIQLDPDDSVMDVKVLERGEGP